MGCMFCLGELAAFVYGIVVLAMGKITISSNKVVLGAPARIIGAILLLPLIIGQGAGFIIGVVIGSQKASKGQQFSAADVEHLEIPLLVLNGAVFVLSFIAIAFIVSAYSGPKIPERRDYYGDQDYLGQRGPFPGGGPHGGGPYGPQGGGPYGGGPYGGPGDQFRQG
jgi:hypothetical protein